MATNVTKFEATIPKDSLPGGYPYSLDYEFFNIESNGSLSTFQPTFSVFDGSNFNLTQTTREWTQFQRDVGSDYGMRGWRNVPCERAPCMTDCQNEFIAPYRPFVERKKEELARCIDECSKGVADPLAECIVENSEPVAAADDPGTSPDETPDETGTPSSPTGSPTGEGGDGADGFTPNNGGAGHAAAGREPSLAWLMTGGLFFLMSWM